MSLRDRLLALLHKSGYAPVRESELARRLKLPGNQRPALSREVRRLVGSGEITRSSHGQIAPRGRAPQRRQAGARRNRSPSPRRRTGSPKAAAALKSAAPPPPRAAELLGRIHFRAGGSAYIVRENVAGEFAEPALQVFPEDTGVALPGDRVVAREFPGRSGRRRGEKVGGVVRVLERTREQIVGNLHRTRRGCTIQADDPRFTYEIRVGDPAASGVRPVPREGDKVVVRLDPWLRRDEPLTGTITGRLGRTHDPRAEMLGLLVKYDLAIEFPTTVDREAAALPDRVESPDLSHRLDYRQRAVFTIDPDDARDFDDALSYESLDGGDVRVGIHIADVSHYVRPGSALDREAERRGNSTYLVGLVIPMLPEKLSNGLCSLVEGEDRLCKAVLLTFGPTGRKKHTAFANTLIRSRKRLTYRQAFAFLHERDFRRLRELPLPPQHQTGSTGRPLRDLTDAELGDLQARIRGLWQIARTLRKDRMRHGSLELDMPETKIFVDAQGYADRLEKIEHDESHQLIEEFMLAANEAVAHLTRTRALPSLYRVHDDPDPEKIEEYRILLAASGIRTGDLKVRAELVRLLNTLRTHPQGHTLRTQLLRSLKKAAYRTTPDGHFGLHKRDYTHFTSPIRRYADLVVHRVFEHHLHQTAGRRRGTGEGGQRLAQVNRLGEHLSLTEITSTEAERDSVKVKLLEFFERELEKQPRTRFAAVITDVRANGFFIELLESMAFGFVSTSTLADDRYSFDANGGALVGRRHRKRYAPDGKIEVVVDRVDRFKRLIDFRPANGA